MAYTTINKSTDYFNTKLYNGNGSAGNAVTGVGFAPDFVWIKERSASSSNVLGTTVQGVNKRLQSDTTSAEGTLTNLLTSFDSDGFTNGADNGVNESGQTYVSWNWKGNGSGSANTTGSLDSTVSVNTTAGFSIVSWTGNGSTETIGHGLGSVPKMIITKSRTNGADWWGTYHHSLGNNKAIFLNDAAAQGTRTYWANSSPTANVFYVSGERSVNGSGENLIAYCFAEKTGYSKFGSYTGNGNANGTFVYTGFKPAMVIIKRSDVADNWVIYDNKRDGFNGDTHALFPNNADTQTTDVDIDLVSNGFKIVRASGRVNASGGSFIYMSFGQSLVGTNNVPCTAR